MNAGPIDATATNGEHASTSPSVDEALPLHVVPAEGLPFEHEIRSTVALVGRSSRAELTIADRSMSREHARIHRTERGWEIEDLGSRNGTYVSGTRISEPTVLRPGDTIALGSSLLTVRAADGPSTAPPVRPGEHTVYRSAAEVLRRAPESGAPQGHGEDLEVRAERLAILNEVHHALARSVALDELLEMILDRTFDHLEPEEGAIFLKNADGEYECAASRSRDGTTHQCLYSRHLAAEVAEKGLAALVLDTRTDDRFNQAQSIMYTGMRCLVAAPLMDDRTPLGMIVLGSTLAVRQFDEEDMELLVSLASVAALRISNVALAEEAADRRRLQQEVTLARTIQVALLPATLPALPGYEVHGGNVPSRGASGDFYKIVERDDGRECVLMVADVSGKGIGAALLTASLEALSAGFLEQGLPPEEICTHVSRLLFERTAPQKFATSFLAVLDVETATLRFCNAGHNPALVVRHDGTVEWLPSTGTPLGILPAARYTAGTARLDEGDLVMLYTDGITEACDPDEEEYGEDRLAEACAAYRTEPLPRLAKALEAHLEEFVKGVPFADDRTVVLVRRSAPTAA